MDVFAHGLWVNLGAKYYNLKFNNKINRFWIVFWGVFPDIFSFGPLFLWSFINKYNLRLQNLEPFGIDFLFINNLTQILYNISHSLVFLLFVVILIFIWRRKFYFEIFGWMIHILIDIPTHSYRFYPTPFLWPISGFKINGFSWAERWFMILNYSLLLILYTFLFKYKNFIFFNKVKRLNLAPGEYTIFGSGPIAIRNLREAKDIDIIVSDKLFEKLSKDKRFKLKKNNNYTYLAWGDVEIFKEWFPGRWNINKLIKESDRINGLFYANLESFCKWKSLLKRPKDLKDFELVQKYLKRHK